MNLRPKTPMLIPERKTASQQTKEQTMKKLSVMIALVGWSGLALGSPIGVYVDDSFTGSTLDSGVWNSSTGGVSIITASTQVQINNGWIQSKAMVSPDFGKTVIVSGPGVWCSNWTSNNSWGLSDATGNNRISLSESSNWYVSITTSGVTQSCFVVDGASMNYSWTINWSPTGVVISKTVGVTSTVMFDSAVNAPNFGTTWNIPTVNMGIIAEAGSGNYLFFDGLKMEVVPEPASLALLALGALPLLRRRR